MPKRSLKEQQAIIAAKLEAEKNGETFEMENDSFMIAKSKIIGRNIRLARRKRKFTLDNLAEYIELSASYVGLLERGERTPSLKSLLKLCELFKIEPNDLLLESTLDIKSHQVTGIADKNEEKHSDNYLAVVSLLHGLGEAELECVITNVKALRKLRKLDDNGLDAGIVNYTSKKPPPKL